MRRIGNFSFSVHWRNTTIIHYFLLAKKVLNIFEKWLWLLGCRSIQIKKEIHSNRKFGSHCFCKIKKHNKNFLKLKCDWWCSYFDTTDGYLRFIPTDGQMTVPFFSGRNLIDEGRNPPKKHSNLFSNLCKYVKPKPISRQNKKLT
jgi:hypothetical protein